MEIHVGNNLYVHVHVGYMPTTPCVPCICIIDIMMSMIFTYMYEASCAHEQKTQCDA